MTISSYVQMRVTTDTARHQFGRLYLPPDCYCYPIQPRELVLKGSINKSPLVLVATCQRHSQLLGRV